MSSFPDPSSEIYDEPPCIGLISDQQWHSLMSWPDVEPNTSPIDIMGDFTYEEPMSSFSLPHDANVLNNEDDPVPNNSIAPNL